MSPRIAWIVLTAATLAAIALFIAAGNWQRARLDAKESQRAQLDAAAAQPPVPLPRADDWNAWRYRRVVLAGTWRGDAQVLVDNRIHDRRAGFAVVTPFALDDGRFVLVDRGFVAAGAGATRVPQVAAPTGRAAVAGRVVVPTERYVELERAGPEGNLWQNLDPRRIASSSGLALLPIVVEQDPLAPADGLARRWAMPDVGAATHRIYMWQWYAFAALAAGLWIGFAVRAWRRSR